MVPTTDLLVRIAKGLLGLVVGTVLFLFLLEGGVRLLAGSLGVSPYMSYHEIYGWTAQPGAIKAHRSSQGEFDVTYEINSLGFRGPEQSLERVPDRFRIVILGDSTGFGWGVSQELTFAGILNRELSGVEVFNLALSGYGPDQSLLRFLHEGMVLRPDLVILQVSPNDFEEIQHSFFNQKPKPRFVMTESGELDLVNVPVTAEGPKASEFYAKSLPLPGKAWLGWHSFAYNILNEQYFGIIGNRSRRTESPHAVFTDASVSLFNAITALLAQRIAEVEARGLIVHSSRVVSENRYLATDHLPVIDMFPVFLEEGRGSESEFYFADGYHWNVAGHRLVADQLKVVIQSIRAEK